MKAYQWTLVSYEEADMEVCTKYYFCKEHAMREGTEAAQRAQVHVENIAITSNYIPLPKAMNFFEESVHGDVVQGMPVYQQLLVHCMSKTPSTP